jgi:hypothetical protein
VPDSDEDLAPTEERLERALDRIGLAARRRSAAPKAAATRELATRLDTLIAKLDAAVGED